MFRKLIIQALEDKYNAQISKAEATIKIYFEKSTSMRTSICRNVRARMSKICRDMYARIRREYRSRIYIIYF